MPDSKSTMLIRALDQKGSINAEHSKIKQSSTNHL